MKVPDFMNRNQAIRKEIFAIREQTGAEVIDPIPWLSEDGYCISSNQDGPIRCDDSHLRPGFVRKYVTYLDKTILD